jgi:integrase
MAQQAPPRSKIPTKSPQPARGAARAAGWAGPGRTARRSIFAGGTGRAATRGGRPVIELECGITVYPAREEHGRWRAVWHENGERQQCEAASEEKLAARLAKVAERLEADAPNMTLRGVDLIAFYLSADRLPVQRQWSRKHAHTQRRLCERFAVPVVGAVLCQDITTRHMQQIVNAAPTPGEGDRVRGMISALVTAGLQGGYLASGRLAQVHWQAGDRALPPPRASAAGESALWIDPAEVPADTDVAALGQALATGLHGDHDELMAVTAAYSGLRWGELAALTIGQVDAARREISVDRKVVEVAGHLFVEAPKNRKYRRTIYPRCTPAGYPLAERLAARLEQARAEQAAGTNPVGLVFPSPTGKYWRSSNFNRNVLQRAYRAAGWRDADGNGRWTWHSLRHVFCTTALFTWKLEATDVSRMAGHSSYRITLDMYVGTTAGVLDRARAATQ